MNIIEIILIGFGLSMDAFAVSITRSLKETKNQNKFIMSLSFGLFQMIMPIIGFYIGKSFYTEIVKWGNWISCIILVTIGLLMIKDSHKEENELESFSIKILFVLSLATSIDALSVGVTFTFANYSIILISSIIGIITFIISYTGCTMGKKIEGKIHNSQIVGGILLQLIGIKLLLW